MRIFRIQRRKPGYQIFADFKDTESAIKARDLLDGQAFPGVIFL